MLSGRRRLPGLAILVLASLTGCTAHAAQPGFGRADVALPSYTAPADAPAFCAALAHSTGLPQVPHAIGVLTVAPGDVEAKLDLSAAVDDLREVLGDVRSTGGRGDLETALGDLVSALQQAAEGTVSDSAGVAIADDMDDVGTQVQSMCGFPA